MAGIRSIFTKKKKKTLGFEPKQRTRDEINQEYNHHAVMYGHSACLMEEAQKQLETIQVGLNAHLDAMVKLRVEGSKLPPAEVPKVETPPEEPKPA